jgi:raffinose/stachyose/melibiose transport system permease protein
VAKSLGLVNNFPGIMVVYLGFGCSFSIFLFHGFIKGIPMEIEEAAVIDGASPLGVFWGIVFPLLKPIVMTVLVLNVLWTWNDFLLPLLIIPSEEMRTIPLAINSFFSQYSKKWDLAMAALVLAIVPVVALFIAAQKSIIEGIVSGSVKG